MNESERNGLSRREVGGLGVGAAMAAAGRLGPTGCGLCGVESLAEALPPLRRVQSDFRIATDTIRASLANFSLHQHLNRQARTLHGAAFSRPAKISSCA